MNRCLKMTRTGDVYEVTANIGNGTVKIGEAASVESAMKIMERFEEECADNDGEMIKKGGG